MIARTWVEGEVATAAKFNTIRDDLLEVNAVAGFFDAQYGSISMGSTQATVDATVSAMSARAVIHYLGHNEGQENATMLGVRLTKINPTTVRATKSANQNSVIVNFVIEDPRG